MEDEDDVTAADEVLEQKIDALVDCLPILPAAPTMDHQHVFAMCTDVARGTFGIAEIAQRYGLTGEQLVEYLKRHRGLLVKIKEIRALWQADVSAKEKGQTLSMHAYNEGVAELAGMMFDKTIKPETRLDVGRTLAKVGGADSSGKEGTGGAGSQFNVLIQFSGGRSESLTTVVEAPAIPAGT